MQNSQFNEPKKRSKAKIILSIVGIIVVGIVVFVGYFFYQGDKDAPLVHAEVREHLDLISNGELDKAYDMTAQEFQNSISRAEFKSTVRALQAQFSGIRELEQVSWKRGNRNGQATFDYAGVVTYEDGSTGEAAAVLVKEGGKWKVEGVLVWVGSERLRKFQQQPDVLGTMDVKR